MSDGRPAAEGLSPGHFPGPPVEKGHVAACPRRIRARTGDGWVLDTTQALYVWEHPYYPQYAVATSVLPAAWAETARSTPEECGLGDHVVLDFDLAEAWFEEDEPVHGHPRNPYVRVDALRSHRSVTVRVPGEDDEHGAPLVLARADDAVAVFETGLPPRWYLDPTCVDWSLLTPSDTVTLCPYKGVTSGYWSRGELVDIAWSYASPTTSLPAIAGLVCFDDAQVDVAVTLGA